MLLEEIMTHDLGVISLGDTLEQAARIMEMLDVGPVPVCKGNQVVGMLTDRDITVRDRDITVRATSAGCDPKTTLVCDAMSQDIISCYEDQDIQEAATLMKEKQVRRLLVMNRAEELVGIVSLGDLATEAGDQGKPGEVLKMGPSRKSAPFLIVLRALPEKVSILLSRFEAQI